MPRPRWPAETSRVARSRSLSSKHRDPAGVVGGDDTAAPFEVVGQHVEAGDAQLCAAVDVELDPGERAEKLDAAEARFDRAPARRRRLAFAEQADGLGPQREADRFAFAPVADGAKLLAPDTDAQRLTLARGDDAVEQIGRSHELGDKRRCRR